MLLLCVSYDYYYGYYFLLFFFEMVLRVRLHNGRFRFYKSFTDLAVITVENVLFEDDDDTRRDTSSHDAF